MNNKTQKYLLYFVPILILALGFVWYIYCSKPTKYIAYIGRFSDYKDPKIKTDFNQLHQDILEQKLEELNSKFPKVKFEASADSSRKSSLS